MIKCTVIRRQVIYYMKWCAECGTCKLSAPRNAVRTLCGWLGAPGHVALSDKVVSRVRRVCADIVALGVVRWVRCVRVCRYPRWLRRARRGRAVVRVSGLAEDPHAQDKALYPRSA